MKVCLVKRLAPAAKILSVEYRYQARPLFFLILRIKHDVRFVQIYTNFGEFYRILGEVH